MSLKVWLPLIDDVHNQGASGVTITNTSSTFVTGGKIGNAIQFGTAKSYLKLDDVTSFHSMTECSISLWLKVLTWNTGYATFFQFGLGTTPWTSYILGLLRNNTASTLCFTIANGSNSTQAGCLTPALDLNTWYHLTFTYKDNHCKIYTNGIETRDYTTQYAPNFAGITNGIIGACNNGSNYQTNCLMNDFRIYDHCLSAAEVKEIAQGLVLHYKLSETNIESTINYVPSPYKDSYASISPGWDTSKHPNAIQPQNWASGYNSGVSAPATGYHAMWNIIESIPTIVFQNHNSEVGKTGRWMGVSSSSLSFSIPANTKYTISYEQRTIDTLGGYTTSGVYYKYNSSIGTNFHDGCPKIGQNTVLNTWERFSYTFTRNSNVDGTGTNGTIYIYGHYGTESTMQIRNIQLEIKDHATAYTISSRNNTDVQDSSGYSHNGTINSEPMISSETARYNSSVLFDGIDDCIIVPYNTVCPENIFTFNLWFKKDTLGSKNYETLFGGPSGFEMDTRAGSATTLSLYMASTRSSKRNLVTELTLGNWYMITMTRDGTKEKYYVNGIFQSEIDAKAMPIGTYRIGAWSSNTSQNYYGLISDFRIYCTALDVEAIRQLYEVGAKIDNKQNLHTFELVEPATKISINKQGQVLCNELEETTATKFFKTDQIIETNNLIEL